MSSNMAIQSANIGGNIVQPTPDGKFKVTTAKGKEKVLTEDQFVKQLKKNEENIKSGKDFEIKKGASPIAKAVGFIAAAGAIVAAVVYRKNIANFFKKSGEAIKEAVTGKPKNKVKDLFIDKHYLSADTKQIKNSTIAQMYSDDGIKAAEAARAKTLTSMKADAEAAFANYDGEAVIKGLKEGKAAKDLGLTAHAAAPKDPKFQSLKDLPLTPHYQALKNSGIKSEAEYAAIKLYAKPETKVIPEKLPIWARDKETCTRYVNSVEASIAKLEKAAADAAKETAEAAVKA